MEKIDFTNIWFFGMMLLFSFVHECAHMMGARLFGRAVMMEGRGIFGNVMYMDPDLPALRRMAVYMAGPAANLIIAALVIISAKLMIGADIKLSEDIVIALEMVMMSNLMLAAFNLLPFYPLDGGRAAVMLLEVFVGREKALKTGAFFSVIFAVCVFISGLYLVQYKVVNLILSADAIYFLYILRGEIYGPYRKDRRPSYEG